MDSEGNNQNTSHNFTNATPLKISQQPQSPFSAQSFSQPNQIQSTQPQQPQQQDNTVNNVSGGNVNNPSGSKAVIGVAAVVILVLVGAYFFVVQPKIRRYDFSTKAVKKVEKMKSGIMNVGSDLYSMFSYVSGRKTQQQGEKLLLKYNSEPLLSGINNILSKGKGEVAGVFTSPANSNILSFVVMPKLRSIEDEYKGVKHFGEIRNSDKVLGTYDQYTTTLSNPYRKLKEQAYKISESTKTTKQVMGGFGELVEESKNINPRLHKSLSETNRIMSEYLDEAEKTSGYYSIITDINIKSIPLFSSYFGLLSSLLSTNTPSLYIERIEEIESSVKELKDKISTIKPSELPQGIEDLHKDNVKILTMWSDNISDIKRTVARKDFKSFITSVAVFRQKLEPLSARAKTLEINFWQNNKPLHNGKKIVANLTKDKKTLEEVRENNKIPFLVK